MDKTGQTIWSQIHPESLRLVCDREPYFQHQDRTWTIEGVVFSDYDLFVCTGGEAAFTVGENHMILSAGGALLVPRNVPLYARLQDQPNFSGLAQHFELKLFGEEDFFEFINYTPLIQFRNWTWIESLTQALSKLVCDDNKRVQRHALFNLILMEFLSESCLSFREEQDHSNRIILDILAVIDKGYARSEVLGEALKKSPYSADYTSRFFKKRMGRPPGQYLIYRRLQKSKDLLSQGFSIKESAFSSGFHDELYFSRLFRKHEGISPSEYRKNSKNVHI